MGSRQTVDFVGTLDNGGRALLQSCRGTGRATHARQPHCSFVVILPPTATPSGATSSYWSVRATFTGTRIGSIYPKKKGDGREACRQLVAAGTLRSPNVAIVMARPYVGTADHQLVLCHVPVVGWVFTFRTRPCQHPASGTEDHRHNRVESLPSEVSQEREKGVVNRAGFDPRLLSPPPCAVIAAVSTRR